jgi:hypothetical protein
MGLRELPRSRVFRRWGFCLCVALVWIRLVDLPRVEREVDLDASWHAGYTHFFLCGLRAGVDYVFNYGPLCALEFGAFEPELYWTRILAWELGFKLLLAVLLVLALAQGRSLAGRIPCLALLLALPVNYDAVYYFAIVAMALLVLERERSGPLFLAAAGGVLAALSLVKFSYLVLASACVLWVAFGLEPARPSGSGRRGRRAAGILAGYALLFSAAWIASGQSPLDIAAYLARSAAIARGYADTMSLPAPPRQLLLAGAVLVLATGLVAARVLRGRSRTDLALALVLAAGFYIAFRGGFIRQRGSVTFFGFAAFAVALLSSGGAGRTGRGAWRVRLEQLAGAACIALSILGFPQVGNMGWQAPGWMVKRWWHETARDLVRLSALYEDRARKAATLEQVRARHDLPAVRAVVGERALDMVGSEQGVVLLNRFAWSPRPVFQDYAAYEPGLMELNARFFQSERAPEFVLLKATHIDRRFPGLGDALAQQILLRDYRPAVLERGYLLLQAERGATRAPLTRTLLREGTLRFGEPLELEALPGRAHVLALDVRMTALGGLYRWLYQGPSLRLEVQFASGLAARYRIAPSLTRAGFLVRPFLADTGEWARWYAGDEPLARVRSLRVLLPERLGALYESEIGFTLLRADDLVPADLRAR